VVGTRDEDGHRVKSYPVAGAALRWTDDQSRWATTPRGVELIAPGSHPTYVAATCVRPVTRRTGTLLVSRTWSWAFSRRMSTFSMSTSA